MAERPRETVQLLQSPADAPAVFKCLCPDCNSDHLHVMSGPSVRMTPETEDEYADAIIVLPLQCHDCGCTMMLWIAAQACGARVRLTRQRDIPAILAAALGWTSATVFTAPAPEGVN